MNNSETKINAIYTFYQNLAKSDNYVQNLYESSINRITTWMNNHDIACITAWRDKLCNIENVDKTCITLNNKELPINYEFSKSDNKKRNSELKAALLYLGYGVTDIHGNYIEEDSYKEDAEESFFVVNKNNDPKFFDTIFKLSEYYNQDSFLYKDVNDKNAYLIGTNASYFPGYENKIKQGPIRFIAGKYMSRIKNAAFSFAEPDTEIVQNKEDFSSNGDQQLFYNSKTSYNQRKTDKIKEKNKQIKLQEDWVYLCENEGINFIQPTIKQKQAISIMAKKVLKEL